MKLSTYIKAMSLAFVLCALPLAATAADQDQRLIDQREPRQQFTPTPEQREQSRELIMRDNQLERNLDQDRSGNPLNTSVRLERREQRELPAQGVDATQRQLRR